MRLVRLLAFSFVSSVLTLTQTGCGVGPLSGPSVNGAAIHGVVMGGRQPIVGSHVYLMEAATTGYNSTYTQNILATGFSNPSGLAVDGSGNIFFADFGNSAVKEILAAGGYTTINTIGSGFSNPIDVAVDTNGNVYVADYGHNAIKEILAAGGYTTVNTLGDGFGRARGVGVDSSGNVFVADTNNSAVKKIPLSCINGANDASCVITLGNGFGFSSPSGVKLDGSGNVYVDDFSNNAVYEILAAGGYTTVNTLGGGFHSPNGVAVDSSGNVFVGDYGNNLVKEIPLSCIAGANNSSCVTTLVSGFTPWGVGVDGHGNVFVADNSSGRIVEEAASAATHTASKSLLTSGSTDSIGTYVTSDSNGLFSINGDYTCDANAQSYLLITGGDSGSGANSAISLMAVLGQCPASGTLTYAAQDPFVTINEVTTVAAAYAMAGYATDSTHVSSNNTALAATGVANAFANAGSLVTLATGVANTEVPNVTGSTAPQTLINTLGNILAACVNSASSSSSACTTLFTNAQLNGASGGQPTDVASAAINIAHNPGNAISALYGLQPGVSAPYAPHLSSAPNDFTVALNFSGGGLNQPFLIAIDASGNAWVTDNGNGNISELSPTGAPLSGSTGYTGTGMSYAYGIAIDASGNAWAVGAFSSTLCKLSPSGTVLSGTGYTGGGIGQPTGIAVDASGNIWTASDGGSLSKFSSTGTPDPSSPFTGGGLSDNRNIAFDIGGNVWAANQGTTTISKLSSTGVPISSSSGYTGGGVNSPFGIGIDNLGNVWTANQANNSISKFSYSGVAVSGSSGYTGGGLNTPFGLAIDGSGNVWIANAASQSLSEFNSSGTPISGSSGYTGSGLGAPHALAIDSSGNVWVIAGGTVWELIGAATPVVTPMVSNLIAPYSHPASIP